MYHYIIDDQSFNGSQRDQSRSHGENADNGTNITPSLPALPESRPPQRSDSLSFESTINQQVSVPMLVNDMRRPYAILRYSFY